MTLREQASGEGPLPVATDAEGRFALLGLAPGAWRVTVEKRGYLPAEGLLEVPLEGVGRPLAIELKPLSEGTPGGLEGDNRQTIRSWLTKGNALLAENRPAEARAEFERALAVLSESEQPPLLRAIARTHYLERNLVGALVALRRAAALAPADAETARLLVAVESEAGPEAQRQAEAELARGAEPEEEIGEPPSLERLGYPMRPLAERGPGAFTVVLPERSPLSDLEALLARLQLPRDEVLRLDPQAGRYELAAHPFSIYLPAGCSPERPCGALVWVSPGPFGGARLERWREALERQRLVWIGANQAGNSMARWTRLGLALDAAHQVVRLFPVDPARLFVAGYSGGGRVSSILALNYPEVFAGGGFVMGCDFYKPLPVPDRPGSIWPPSFKKPQRAALERAKRSSRLVFLTGERDFNRVQTRDAAAAYRAEGFRQVDYLEFPGISHYGPFDAALFGRLLSALAPLPVERP